MDINNLQPWELLMKKIVWKQLGTIEDKRVLDFGSGFGITANYLARNNDVIAIEPSAEAIKERKQVNKYEQLCGSTELLRNFSDESFDVIICHNVFEYAPDRDKITKEFARILKKDGFISIVKHNPPGRVMQMVVLLNDFKQANSLLDGNDGVTTKFGKIHYYEDTDISKWCKDLLITKTMGMRTFWDLQQNQEIHKNSDWQNKMIDIEMRVSEMEEYKNIAFFHHLIIKKNR